MGCVIDAPTPSARTPKQHHDPNPTHPPLPLHAGRDVDHVITTKDLAKMCQDAGIDFASLPGVW